MHDAQIFFGGVSLNSIFSCTVQLKAKQGVFADADSAGYLPNLYLKELLQKGNYSCLCDLNLCWSNAQTHNSDDRYPRTHPHIC